MTTIDAIKATRENGEMYLDVLGLPYGTDRQQQTFDAQTNIDLSEGDSIPVYYFHGFAERAAKSVGRIGNAVYKGADSAGHWFRVKLDSSLAIARQIFDDAAKGLVRASSDSASHLVRPHGIVGKPGKVTNWPIFGMSLMDAATHDAAVNPRAIAIAAAKAYLEEQAATTQTDTGDEVITITGEAGALKAGATFARRNRDRLLAMKAALDEMLSEVPADVDPNTHATVAAATGDQTVQVLPATKGILDLEPDVALKLVRRMVSDEFMKKGIVLYGKDRIGGVGSG